MRLLDRDCGNDHTFHHSYKSAAVSYISTCLNIHHTKFNIFDLFAENMQTLLTFLFPQKIR